MDDHGTLFSLFAGVTTNVHQRLYDPVERIHVVVPDDYFVRQFVQQVKVFLLLFLPLRAGKGSVQIHDVYLEAKNNTSRVNCHGSSPNFGAKRVLDIMFQRKSMEALERRSAEDVIQSPAHDILLILDEVRSMHNVGSAFRTADAFGLSGLFLCGFTPQPPHRDIRKTALGAEDSVRWQHFQTTEAALEQALQLGYELVGVEQVEGSVALQDFQIKSNSPIALVFGNEVSGLSDASLQRISRCIEIPQFGAKHSLNISVSIGVVLWEIVRGGV